MGGCSFIIRIVTLDHLYDMDKTKGRANWLIFLICKVMAPALLVMVTESDEILTYGDTMMRHYKKSLRSTCLDIQHVRKLDKFNRISSDSALNQLLNELENLNKGKTNINMKVSKTSKLQIQEKELDKNCNCSNHDPVINKEVDTKLGASLHHYLMLLENENMSSPIRLKQKQQNAKDVKFCCDNFRKTVTKVIGCMRKKMEQNKDDIVPFGVAMFFPCFGAIIVALWLAPIKHISAIRNKILTNTNPATSNLQTTPEEKLSTIKDCLHFIADLIVFYLIVHKIKNIGSVIMGSCVQNQPCLIKFTSMQVRRMWSITLLNFYEIIQIKFKPYYIYRIFGQISLPGK
ncbi:uncharacterized protein LOC120339388 isoform X1 [Styela clava]